MRASLRIGWIRRLCVVAAIGAALESRSNAENLPVVLDVEYQPFVAQVKRVIDALELLGQPLDRDERTRLTAALDQMNAEHFRAFGLGRQIDEEDFIKPPFAQQLGRKL